MAGWGHIFTEVPQGTSYILTPMNLLFTQKMGIQHTNSSGVSCHLCFFKWKAMLCLPVTLQFSQPSSQPMQHRPNCGATEGRGCSVGHNTLPLGLKRKIQQLGALTASLAKDQHGKLYWLALVSKDLFPRGVSCPEQVPGWIQRKGLQGPWCTTSTRWHKSTKDSAVSMLPS